MTAPAAGPARTPAPSAPRTGGPHLASAVPLLAVLVVGLLAGATALVAGAGPAELGPDRLGAWVASDLITPTPVASGTSSAEFERPPDLEVPGWLPSLSVLVVSALVALAVRSLLRLVHDADGDAPPSPRGDAAGDAVAVHLGVLRRTLHEGALRLRSGAHAGTADEVIRCWEGLEDDAGLRGVPRPPHQTPSEFSAELLRSLGADPLATEDLLHLYHRARFSAQPLPADAAGRAAADLEAIAASLGDHDGAGPAGPDRG